jgi:predicted transcriptional regulator
MVAINIPDKLARRLTEIAQQENRSLDEVASSILEEHVAQAVDEVRPGSPEAFIKYALAADIHTGERDVADRSREILDTEFPAHLWRQMKRDDRDNDSAE